MLGSLGELGYLGIILVGTFLPSLPCQPAGYAGYVWYSTICLLGTGREYLRLLQSDCLRTAACTLFEWANFQLHCINRVQHLGAECNTW